MSTWWKYVLAGVTGLGIFLIKRCRKGAMCRSQALMVGKTVLITGANTGIGKPTACEMARRKARVILACRDVDKGNRAVQDIRRVTQEGELVVRRLDLASFKSIHSFADEIIEEEQRLDVLINNAGVMHYPFAKTEDGFEIDFGVNHLGHFLLTNLLLELLRKSSPSRIVIVSSSLHKRSNIKSSALDGTPTNIIEILNKENNYDKFLAYANSKLSNNLFARELSSRLKDSGVNVYCLHPGVVRTELGRHTFGFSILRVIFGPLMWLLLKSANEGSQTIVYCSVDEQLSQETGRYYGNCREEPWTPISLDDGVSKKLWELSEKWTGLA